VGLVVGEGMAAVFEIAVSAEKNKKNKGQVNYRFAMGVHKRAKMEVTGRRWAPLAGP